MWSLAFFLLFFHFAGGVLGTAVHGGVGLVLVPGLHLIVVNLVAALLAGSSLTLSTVLLSTLLLLLLRVSNNIRKLKLLSKDELACEVIDRDLFRVFFLRR